MNREPSPRVALHADGAAHQLDQLPGNGQSQAGASKSPSGGSVRLRELFEQQPHLVGRNADARIGDRDAHHGVIQVWRRRNARKQHLAFWVNFTPLAARFVITCRMRPASPEK